MKEFFKRTLCNWTHDGGHVKRDPSGSINWQCATCKRWYDDSWKTLEIEMTITKQIRVTAKLLNDASKQDTPDLEQIRALSDRLVGLTDRQLGRAKTIASKPEAPVETAQ